MKKFQQSFAKPIIHMIIRMMIILLVFESFATSAYSQIATTSPASRCGAGTVTLGATGTGTIKWFTVPFYGTAVATGGSFTTPSMSVTKTYFVDAVDAASCSLNTNQARVPVIATISSGSIQAAIFYTSNTFCKSVSGDQLVTRTGTAGGAYSAAVGLTLNSSTGAITPSSSTNGVYTVRYHITIPASGCTENDATTPVTITTTPTTPIIRYAETPTTPISYCTTAGTITVDHTGAIGGTYSASPTGLTIDASSGTITTASSLSGTYTVTYFVPGLGGCDAMTAQATGVTILQLPTSAISYASLAHSYFAINQGTQLASLTGTGVYTGGTYSYTGAGTLTIVTTGEGAGTITPASSTAGTYTVTYTLASVNPCAAPTPATTIVTIYPLPTATIVSNQTVCQNSTAPDITFTGAGGTAPYTFTYHINSGPDQTVTTTSGNSVTVSQSTAVTGTFTYTLSHVSDANSSSQSQTGTATITVSAVSVALFSYEGTPYCSSGANPVPTMLEGGVKGTFSAASGVLFVSATTGEINLATSTAGTYTVTNTIAASGGCGIITATSSVTITKLPVSTFTYGSTNYCQNAGTNPSPVLGTSAVTGIFTSVPAGVVFVSATTGEIDLVNTPANAYQIVNTIAAAGGCADVPAHFDLTIGAPPSTPVINYSGLTYCSSISEAQPVELTGTSGGAFTYEVTSGGPTLTLSPTTGAITPITSSPGVYLITYTVGGGSGCAPVTATRSVTIYQTPVVNNSNAYSICSGTNTGISLTATISSTFTWTLGTVSANIMEAYVGTGETISQELINTSYTEPGTVQYLVTPTSTVNGCVGAPYTITVTVNAAPQVVTTSPAAVCAPGSVNITLDAITTGSTGGLTFTYWPTFEANTTALSNPAAIAVSGTYYVKGSAGTGCYSVGNIIVVVNPLPVAPTAGNVTVTYDGAVHTGTASPPASASVVWYDAETGGNVTVAPQGTNYGTYTAYAESKAELTPTQCVSAMRTLVTVTINKASLAITANDATKPYGTLISGAAGSTEFTSSGLQNGETIGTVTIAYGTGSSANSAVATYTDQVTASAATGGTFTASNYTITYLTGAIIVGAKALAITANNNTKTYGTLITGGALSTAFTSVGLQNGETIGTVTIAFGTGSAADAAVTTYANQVNVSDATGGTFTASNYTITYPTGAIIVGAKVLTVTADNQSKTDNGAVFSPFTSIITGYVNGETIGVVSGLPATYTGAATSATTSGIYNSITPVVTGLSATNYSFTPVNGTLTIYPVTPTGPVAQSFCSGQTVAQLKAAVTGTTGTLIVYDAATDETVLTDGIALTTGNYYVSQTINSTESARLTIVVTVNAIITGNTSGSEVSICNNSSTTLTGGSATGGSGSYTYLWESSDALTGTYTTATGTNNTANYTTAELTITSTVVYFRRTVISGGCSDVATGVKVTVNPYITASVSIAASANPTCAGTSVTFTATPTNGGATPDYGWQKNGATLGAPNLSTYSGTLSNGDIIKVVMNSNASPCLSDSPATSNSITMTVYAKTDAPVVTLPILVGATSVSGTCESGATVTVYVDGASPVTAVTTTTAWTATVSALTEGQVVTAKALASDKCISVVSSSVTVSVLAVGAAYQGGKVAYIFVSGDPGYHEGETHGIIAAISDNATSKWGCIGTLTSAIGTVLGTGNQNTTSILAVCSTSGIAAKLCKDLGAGWYLPSKDELYKLYLNRVAIGNFNTTATGLYWSSSEDPASTSNWNSTFYDFSTGGYQAKDKDELYLSRAVRTF